MVIGSYKCGCTYGPISKRKRLAYCSTHGQDIQREYPLPYVGKSSAAKAKEAKVDIVQEALMTWGNAMDLRLEKRCLFYSTVLDEWRVTVGVGHQPKTDLYHGKNFRIALDYLLGTRDADNP